MYSNQGFTLIELLVVVLIIGILGSIAVALYPRVLVRVHNAEAAAALRTIGRGIELYNLENGPLPDGYSTDFSLLDVQPAPSKTWNYSYVCFDEYKSCGIYASFKKGISQVGDKQYELTLSVHTGVMNSYIQVLEVELLSHSGEGDNITTESSLGDASAEMCKKAAATLDADKGCILP